MMHAWLLVWGAVVRPRARCARRSGCAAAATMGAAHLLVLLLAVAAQCASRAPLAGASAGARPPSSPSPACAPAGDGELGVAWDAAAAAQAHLSQVMLLLAPAGEQPARPAAPAAGFATAGGGVGRPAWAVAQTSPASAGGARVAGLARRSAWRVSLRALPASSPAAAWGEAWTAPSEAVTCVVGGAGEADGAAALGRRAPLDPRGSRSLRVFRISEYSEGVDLLANHDGADALAMPLYLMTCQPDGTNCSPWSAREQSPRWDECHAALAGDAALRCERGGGLACLACAEAQASLVRGACGEWSPGDTLAGEGSFAVHWFCGVGWPEGAPAEAPITEYCVDYLPLEAPRTAPKQPRAILRPSAVALPDDDDADASGFSGYLSCNSDEVDGMVRGYHPIDPQCACIVYDDRLLAHQTRAELARDCGASAPRIPWVNETTCNCTGGDSPLPEEGSPSLSHVGRAPVWLPYVGVGAHPAEFWNASWGARVAGYNYHFPRGGECGADQPLGSGGCTWRRRPRARLLFGDALLAAGWDRSFVPDAPGNFTHTLANQAAFARAWEALGALAAQESCGGA